MRNQLLSTLCYATLKFICLRCGNCLTDVVLFAATDDGMISTVRHYLQKSAYGVRTIQECGLIFLAVKIGLKRVFKVPPSPPKIGHHLSTFPKGYL